MSLTDKTFTEKFIEGLKNAATELEELQVQIALGKAEARDVFEDLKSKFNARLNELKSELQKVNNNKNIVAILKAVESVQFQLTLRMTETKEMFEDQLQKILKQIKTLESELNKSDMFHTHAAEIQLELEKFKAKMELISLHLKLKKVIVEYNLEQKKIDFHHKMDLLRVKIQDKENEAKNTWNFFKKEMDEAYAHLKKAFVQ